MPASFTQPLSRSAAAVALLVLLAATATAQSDPPLGPGDTLLLRSVNQPELGGEYMVQADGALTLPSLGRVPVAGQKPDEVEAALARLLRERQISTQPDVGVEVSRYRDFYVSGDVANPGAYAWRPDLTVRQALALAGGRGLPGDEVSQAVQAIRADEYLVALDRQIAALDASRARLEAEVASVRAGDFRSEDAPANAPKVDWPAMPSTADGEALIRAQQTLLEADLERDRASMASLNSRHDALSARRDALQQRQGKLDEADAILAERLSTVEGLTASGLARRPEVLELRQAVLDLASTRLEVIADIAEAEGALAEVDLDRDSFADVRLSGLASELAQVGSQLLEARARVDPARRAARVSAGYAPRPSEPFPVLTVVRRTATALAPLTVAEDDPLQPGDTLLVPPLSEGPDAVPSQAF